MASPILPTTVSIPRLSAPAANLSLSSIRFFSGAHQFPLLHTSGRGRLSSRELVIRMGGGPRTFPGGVSKWQWKRMQAKKAKQLLKARLCRERQLYEMRKRTELRAAATELERPWEVIERAPNLFSVGADEQLKALADRFQLPGGFDMWNDRDGPQVFRSPADGLPTARFFPKGVVHSIKPYGVDRGPGEGSAKEELRHDDWIARGAGGIRRRRSRRSSYGGGDGRSSEEAVDVKATTLDEGTDPRDQNATFTSKNSRSVRNLNNPNSSTREKSRVSLPEGDRTRNRSNSQKQRFAGRFGWNESDETVDYLQKLKVEDAGVSRRNHGIGKNQEFGARFSEGENGKIGGRRRQNNSTTEKSRVSLPEGDRTRNRSNSQKQRFAGRFGWKEFDETVDYLQKLKVEDAGVSRRNHGNGKNQEFGARFIEGENGKIGGRRRQNNTSNGRSRMEKMTLRPTSELFHRDDRNAMGEH